MVINHTIRWGLTLGIATSMATQILTWVGLGLSQWFIIISLVFVAIAAFISSGQLKIKSNGWLTFKKALVNIVIMILIARVIFQIYMFIYTRFVDPEWVDNVSVSWSASMEASGMTAESIEQSIDQFRQSYETIPMFTTALITYAVPQFVVGLLASLYHVLRK